MTLTNLLNDPAVEAMVVNARDLSERKLIEMQIEQQAGEIADLYETSRRLGASLALEDVARAAVERVREMLNPDLVLLFLVRGDTLYLKAHAPGEGPLSPRIAPGQFVGAALGKLAAASGRPVYSLDAREDRHCDPREAQQAGVISQAAVPLGSGGRVIGVMVLATASERDFQPQATFFEALAEPLAMALGNALAHEAMQRHAAELEAQVAGPTGQLKAANRKIEVFS
jgi:GAF domain-containing protein